ncbi:hypothetical protein ACFL06_01795 [Patescibacteria group bacterium]
MENQELLNFVKYCLSYIKLTRQRTFLVQQKYAVDISEQCFNLDGFLNGDMDGKLEEIINLKTFYNFDPKEVSDDISEKYEEEKDLANKIDDIYNKYRNDPFRKQTMFSFGYFEIELPVEVGIDENNTNLDIEDDENNFISKTKIDRYPLFSIPIKIEKNIERGLEDILFTLLTQKFN